MRTTRHRHWKCDGCYLKCRLRFKDDEKAEVCPFGFNQEVKWEKGIK